MPITKTLLEVSSKDPGRVAIFEGKKSISYGELIERAPKIYGAVLAALTGTEADARVAISLSGAFEAASLVAMLAGFKTVTSLLDVAWPILHRVRAISEGELNLLITDDAELRRAIDNAGLKVLVLSYSELQAAADAISAGHLVEKPLTPFAVRHDDEPFLLIFTSGTTDLPKGFYRTRFSWRYNALVSRKYLHTKEKLLTFAPGPLSYSLTLYALIEVLESGGTIELMSAFDPLAAVNTLLKKSVPRLVCVPAILPALHAGAKRSHTVFEDLRYVVVGGAGLGRAVRETFAEAAPNAEILNYYGAAEIGFIGYQTAVDEIELKPFSGVELSVRTGGKDLPRGETGTIFVRVPSQTDMYVAGAKNAPVTLDDGWSTVLDEGYLTETGFVLIGRAGEVAITGGHKVSLQQVDRALEKIVQSVTGITAAVSLAVADKNLGQIVVAVFEVVQPPDRHVLQELLKQELPPQFLPKRYFFTSELPRTAGGKIRRAETQELYTAGKLERLN